MLAGGRWRWALPAVIVGYLTGCLATPEQPARLGLRLAPATLGATLSLQQHLSLEREGRVDVFDAALEADAERLDVVGLALGRRMYTLHYDGHALQTWRDPSMPMQLRGEDVLEDLQLTFWPIDAIERALPTGWDISETARQRVLRLFGEPIMMIDYSSEPRWIGKVVLTNLRYDYRLTIESVANTP